MFAGLTGKNASVLNHEAFIDFQEWFDSSVWKLSSAGVPVDAHVKLLSQKRVGPLQKVCMREQQENGYNLSDLTVEELQSRLSALYHDAKLKFTDAVLLMSFRREHLAQDITKFRTYALHSSFANSIDPASESAVYAQQIRVYAQGLRWTQNEQLFIPNWENLRFDCFESVHKHPFSGHLGAQRTLQRLSYTTGLIWPVNFRVGCLNVIRVKGFTLYAKNLLASCIILTFLTVVGNPSLWILLLIYQRPRWETTQSGSVWTVSKMVHLKALTKTVTAPELARIFRDEIFRLHGLPDSIVSDRCPRFTASFWSQLHKLLGVSLNLSTRDHPQSDGQTENANGILADTL
jgi:hypothetical protein